MIQTTKQNLFLLSFSKAKKYAVVMHDSGKKGWVSSAPHKAGSAIRPLSGRLGLVFGVPLESLLAKDQHTRPYLRVPLFVHKALKYLTVNGTHYIHHHKQ